MMKRCIYLLALLLAVTSGSQAQLPQAYHTHFEQAGYYGTIPAGGDVLTLSTLDATGATDVSGAINAAITTQAAKAQGGVVYVPAGTYLLTSPIKLKSKVILRGAGAHKTHLLSRLTSGNPIDIKGTTTGGDYTLAVAAPRQSTQLQLSSVPSNVVAGSLVYVMQKPGIYAFGGDSWAQTNNALQVVYVERAEGKVLHLRHALRWDYTPERQAVVKQILPITNAGVEALHIKGLTAGISNDNISVDYAYNCWVVGVEVSYCNSGQIDIRRSTNVQVSGCYFHHGYDYGGGGSAYGVCITGGAGQVLVANCVFDSLRHAMLAQAFASGNVFAYNYSARVNRTDFPPADKAGDMVLHGNYAHSNLFEGNIAQNMVIDNPHGANGPRNVFLRNRFELYGVLIDKPRTDANSLAQDAQGVRNDSTVMIANEVTHAKENGYGLFSIFAASKGNILQGNLAQGAIYPTGTTAEGYTSLLTSEPPLFWNIADPWLGIGTGAGTTIPAKYRYDHGLPLTDTTKRLFGAAPRPDSCQSPKPVVENKQYPQHAQATALTAQGVGLLWYAQAQGGLGSTQAPVPLTTALGKEWYYVSQTLPGCKQSGRAAIEVTVVGPTLVQAEAGECMWFYPNPFSDYLLLSAAAGPLIQANLYNTQGTLVRSMAATHALRMDTNELACGSYIMRMRLADGQYAVQRLVKQ